MAEETAMMEVGGDFEAMSVSNGGAHWLASALMELLGVSPQSFQKALNRAMTVCATLNLKVYEHFHQFKGEDGKDDWRLTRFACYLAAMNSDPRNMKVAAAQAHFAHIAAEVDVAMENAESVERVHVRQEVSERTKALAGVAKERKVENYARFQNAGYLGMYNMHIARLREVKRISESSSPLDFMGKRELAANLFRLTETEASIRNNAEIRGQAKLEETAHRVGRAVRKVMVEEMNAAPEDLAQEVPKDIGEVRKQLKEAHRGMRRLDAPKKPARRKKAAQ